MNLTTTDLGKVFLVMENGRQGLFKLANFSDNFVAVYDVLGNDIYKYSKHWFETRIVKEVKLNGQLPFVI